MVCYFTTQISGIKKPPNAVFSVKLFFEINGRSSRIRTYDPLVPNQVHYQAVLCSELG